ncbi:MAG: adenylate/guanylate cyclase domain-containing protein [Alphaproteobacteria bacterium]|nr:adenylate/guanylate cyclase domain-containing protein [Alphaproteobacteria bacterium]
MSTGSAQAPSLAEARNLILTEEVELPQAERPRDQSIAAVAAWLVEEARRLPSAARFVDEFAWRMLAAGLPLLRVTLHCGTLHPQFLGATYTWWRTSGRTRAVMIAHEVADLIPYADNPVRRVSEGGEVLRRRLEGAGAVLLDFPVLHELKASGATDYFALPVTSALGSRRYMATYVTDRRGGFTAPEIEELTGISPRLAIPADMFAQRAVAENVLKAYIGQTTGPRVLAGRIRRGAGEEIKAVLWSSDLRSFTQLSDRLSGDRIITMLNAVFDAQAIAIESHGGEILKFIGDGLLAIFPIADKTEEQTAAQRALAAAGEAFEAVRHAFTKAMPAGEPPVRMVVALHCGTVIYGNIGAAARLDFIVIGPAVNLVSRVETVAKALDLPIVVSEAFARAYGGDLRSLGRHELRGLAGSHELFAPEPPPALLV